ncbi:MAG: hydrogenase maturation protease [Candidatus Krumholzibacteria bacterium]|nr:hydrogenase maturation protease [Candidatus Krumholzibacteria bacterium]
MKGLEEELLGRLEGKRFGVVGIGNVIKGDDGAGCMVVEKLGEGFAMPTVDCAEVPENYGGWVERRDLQAVVYVDAVEFAGEPGEVRIIPLEKMMQSATSTHHLSLHYMIKFLKNEWEGDAIMVGIQPVSMGIGEGVCNEVAAGAELLVGILRKAVE